MKTLLVSILLAGILLAGCMGPGSPRITITKNIYIVDSSLNGVDLEYTTQSSTESMAEITQDLKDLLDLKLSPR